MGQAVGGQIASGVCLHDATSSRRYRRRVNDAEDRAESSPEQHARLLAHQRSVHALPAGPYIGLTLDEARATAAGQGRSIRVLSHLKTRRPSLNMGRVNVVLDEEGRIAEAATDTVHETDRFPPRPSPTEK